MRLWHVTHEYTSGYASKSVATEITLFFGKIQYQLMLLFHCKKKKKKKKTKEKKFPIKYFFSKCDQIRRFFRIWSYLLKKSLMVNFIFLCSNLYWDNFMKMSTMNSNFIVIPVNTREILNIKFSFALHKYLKYIKFSYFP